MLEDYIDAPIPVKKPEKEEKAVQPVDPPRFEEGSYCNCCKLSFTAFQRRHHCRHCGLSFCHSHSKWKLKITKFGLKKPVRCCKPCSEALVITTHDSHQGPLDLDGDIIQSI
jgi:growth factor-regulated tyrosine kinase substrate